MADLAGIEASQERVHRNLLQDTREQALRHFLLLYVPTLDVNRVPYREVLTQAQTILHDELARLETDTP